MKVIFLDVGGVLTHSGTRHKGDGQERLWRYLAQIDEECMKRLVYLINQTGAKVVLVSEWRIHAHSADAIAKAFRVHGLRRSTIIGHTPVLKYSEDGKNLPPRAWEIQAWLAEAEERGELPEKYVWIDDEPALASRFNHPVVHVAGGYYNGGLQSDDVEEALKILGRSEC